MEIYQVQAVGLDFVLKSMLNLHVPFDKCKMSMKIRLKKKKLESLSNSSSLQLCLKINFIVLKHFSLFIKDWYRIFKTFTGTIPTFHDEMKL